MSSCGSQVMTFVGASLLMMGCGVMPADSEEDAVASAEEAIIILNGDAPNFFWERSTQDALRRLATQRLVTPLGQLGATPLDAVGDGHALLHYVFLCALGPKVAGSSSTTPGVSFNGGVGLAPEWESGPLNNERSQRWVTACLLQTLNGVGAHVQLHAVGAHPGLADDPNVDVSKFTFPDATMFGNIFAPGAVEVYACPDRGVYERCELSWSVDAIKRICDTSSSCGLTVLPEPCDRYCTYDEKTGFPTCTTPGGITYEESISTTLEEINFPSMYPECTGTGTDTGGATRREREVRR